MIREDYNKVLEEFGLIPITNCTSTSCKTACINKNGLTVIACIDKVRNSNKTPKEIHVCNPYTIDNINKLILRNISDEYKCVSDTYTDNKTLLDILHIKCGTLFKISWTNIQKRVSRNGCGELISCNKCNTKRTESMHALVLKQVMLKELCGTVVEDTSCINPLTGKCLPTDIVNHNLKISIEIQSWFHERPEQKIKDVIKKDYWINNGYEFIEIDHRDVSIIDMINIFIPHVDSIPHYIDTNYSNKVDLNAVKKLLDKGTKIKDIANRLGVKIHRIYDCIYINSLSYPDDYVKMGEIGVVQLNLNGEYINRFDSIKDASRYNNIKYHNISHAMNKKRVYSSGYLWVKECEYDKNFSDYYVKNINYDVNVHKYSLKNEYICSYDSILEAEVDTGIKKNMIYAVAFKNKRKTTGGFIWKNTLV